MRGTLVLAAMFVGSFTYAADWPHWLGPNRNGSSPETGLLTTWPASGPKILWKVRGGEGYSTIAVAKGLAITLVQHDGAEHVLALDAATGAKKWEARIAPAYKNQYGNGPRSTPTIDGDFVYAQSVSGPLVCLSIGTGEPIWSVDLLKTFGGKNISWGLSASPIVEGNLVLAVPGGNDASVAGFDKKTGKVLWKVGSDKAGYASPIAVSVGGKKQFVFFTASSLFAVSDEGKELWNLPWSTEFGCNICTPIAVGDSLFVSSGEEMGCVLLKLSAGGPPEVAWESKGAKSNMLNYWANSVVHNGYLYGLSGEFSKKIHLNCVELSTGKLMWSKKDFGKGAICLADGHLFMTTKKGELVLIQANPKEYEEKARVELLGDNRTAPTLSDRRLFVRDKENILCLDLTK